MAENKVIAVDLGGTNLRVGLVINNKVTEYIKVRTPKTKKKLINELFNNISKLIEPGTKGIGIASPGPLINGIIKNPPNLPLKNFNLKKALQKKFKLKTEVENDANCVALAESKVGCKKNNFFALTLGTGIGGGVIINGKLYTGEGYASEPGHIILDQNKDFETLWKEKIKNAKKHFGKKITIKEMIEKRDKFSKKALDGIIDVIAKGTGSLINVFDPEVVILMGGIRETGNAFLKPLKKQTKKYVLLPRKPDIQWSKIKHPGILGASLLIK